MVNYLELSIAQTGAPINVHLKMCYNSLDDTQRSMTIQSYCRTEYATYTEYGGLPSNQSCSVALNNMACDSCTVATCNATDTFQSTDAFDCSNVESNVVVEDVCGGNTIWKEFLAVEFPTSEPTGYPMTAEPTAAATTPQSPPPATDNEDDAVDSAPTVPDGQAPALAPTPATDSSPTSGALPSDTSGAALYPWASALPWVMMSGMLGLGIGWN